MDLQRGRFPSKPFPFSGGGTSLRLSHFRLELGLLMLSRVQNLKHNFAIVDALTEIATRKGITPAQLSIAWVSARGPHVVPLPGSSCVLISPLMPQHSRRGRNAKRTLENIAGGNVDLSSDDLNEIDGVLSSHAVKGGRYFDTVPDEKLHLWG